jgi:hypothetical protein
MLDMLSIVPYASQVPPYEVDAHALIFSLWTTNIYFFVFYFGFEAVYLKSLI